MERRNASEANRFRKGLSLAKDFRLFPVYLESFSSGEKPEQIGILQKPLCRLNLVWLNLKEDIESGVFLLYSDLKKGLSKGWSRTHVFFA